MNLICPIDNKDDSIQKVSAVVTGGESTGTFSGPTGGVTYSGGKWGSVSGYSSLSGSSTTTLARLLTAPSKPLENTGWWIANGCGWIYIIMGILLVIILVASRAGTPTYSIFTSILLSVLAGGICSGMGFLFRALGNKQKKNAKEKYSNEMNTWSDAMKRWSRLYYCFKHDIVFDPVDGEYCEPAKLSEFINKPLAR